MATKERSFSASTLYVEVRRLEIEAQAAEIRRARQARAGQHLRHRLGYLLIALGEALSQVPTATQACGLAPGASTGGVFRSPVRCKADGTDHDAA